MISFFFCLHQHIFNVDFDVLLDLFVEHAVHESLVGGFHIFQAEGHNFVTK